MTQTIYLAPTDTNYPTTSLICSKHQMVEKRNQLNKNFLNEITRVIRSDTKVPGLLFVGTETGIYISTDDGGQWDKLSGKFPVVPVYDLKVKGSDLVVATHGRSFWILDNIEVLRKKISTKSKFELSCTTNGETKYSLEFRNF